MADRLKRPRPARAPGKRSFVRGLLLFPFMVVATFYGLCTLSLLLYSVVPPPITGVQLQRQVEALAGGQVYDRDYRPVAGDDISRHMRHAVVAAEDGRFYQHHGVDWSAVQKAAKDNVRRGRVWRGGSTLTQQLVKNLFLVTYSSFIRKGLEIPLAYIADLVLSKERILTLYLNVIEFGDGVFGVEAAAQHYYGIPAAQLTRRQAAQLAAIIPNPRERDPRRMGRTAARIQRRMSAMGY